MKKLSIYGLPLILAALVSCGKVDPEQVAILSKEMPILISITVDIGYGMTDPELYIKAKDIEVDRVKKEITIRGQAFISSVLSVGQRNLFAIKIENTKFSLPIGGKITIKKMA